MLRRNGILTILVLLVLLLPALPGVAIRATAGPNLLPDPAEAARHARNAFSADGAGLRADNGHLQAALDAWGFTFTPYVAGTPCPAGRLGLRLREAWRGDTLLYTAPPGEGTSPEPGDEIDQARYRRPAGILEVYLAADYEVEQLFVLATALPGTGDLRLVQTLSTTLAPREVGRLSGPARFPLGAGQDVAYGPALARDAAGREVAVPLSLADGALTLVVPGDWLAEATYPVIVDPALGVEVNLSDEAHEQATPAVAASDGDINDDYRYLAVWADARNSLTSGWDIYGRFVTADGTPNPTAPQIRITSGGTDEQAPAVAYITSTNRYLVAWQESGAGVYGLVLDWDGTVYRSRFLIANVTGDQRAPALAYDADHQRFLVAWEDYRTTGNNGDVYARYVTDGGGLGTEYPIAATTAAETAPATAYDTQHDHFLLTWQSGDGNLWARGCNDDGNPTGHTAFMAASSVYEERAPDVAYSIVDAGFLVVYERGTGSVIYGQEVAWSGTTQDYGIKSAPSLLSPSGIGFWPRYSPRVVYGAGTGEYVVVWRYGTGAIEAQQSHGGGRTEVVWTVSGDAALGPVQGLPAVAFNAVRNQYYVVWQSDRGIGLPQNDILGRRVDNSLVIANDMAGISLFYPAVAYNADNQEFLVVWARRVSANPIEDHIYGRRITRQGALVGASFAICTNTSGGCGTGARPGLARVRYPAPEAVDGTPHIACDLAWRRCLVVTTNNDIYAMFIFR